MRLLTIQRIKSFVGSLGKLKVYIEDAAANELEINGVPCKKLGELKNGEQQQFEITEQAARVYVIADKLSKGFCSEFYPLPAGSEDVFLSGKCHFNPMAGNAFRFDGVTDETVLQNRKKNTLKGLPILIVALAIGFALGFFLVRGLLTPSRRVEPKTFTKDGMSITLTGSFREKSYPNFDFGFEANDAMVFGVREQIADYPGIESVTLEEYASWIPEIQPAAADAVLQRDGDLRYLEYSAEAEGTLCRYLVGVYRSDKAFWIINFATTEELYAAKRADFLTWAKSVTFSE